MASSRRADAGGRAGLGVPLVVAGWAALFFLLPALGLALRVPWAECGALLRDPLVLDALTLSLFTSVLAVLLSLLGGAPIAWMLAERRFPGRDLLRALTLMPMVMPPVVAGVALLAAFGRRGLLGAVLERWGVQLPFSTAAVIVAQAFVASPFLIAQLEAGFAARNRAYEAVAEALGASRPRVFFTITLPLIRPALLSGLAVCWARALGEFGATITFAGNLEGVTQTMPLAIYTAMESRPESAYLMAFLLFLLSFLVIFLLRGRLAAALAGDRT